MNTNKGPRFVFFLLSVHVPAKVLSRRKKTLRELDESVRALTFARAPESREREQRVAVHLTEVAQLNLANKYDIQKMTRRQATLTDSISGQASPMGGKKGPILVRVNSAIPERFCSDRPLTVHSRSHAG